MRIIIGRETIRVSPRELAEIIGSKGIRCPKCEEGTLIRSSDGNGVFAVACWSCGTRVDLENTELIAKLVPKKKEKG